MCTAKDTDLADKGFAFCHQDLSEALVEEFLVTKLWDKWGLVGDVIMNPYYHFLHSNTENGFVAIFTSYFPRVDIHSMISPDLLHQVIKGTFKDHLITWIVNYICSTNLESEAS